MRSPLLPAGLAALLAAPLAAQSLFVYAANSGGTTSANAYPLDELSHTGNSGEDTSWRDLFVQGADRWLIRGDGEVDKNGKKLTDLADDDGWRGIVVDDEGVFFALRQGGKVSGPGGVVKDYAAGDFDFADIITDGQAVYVLRTNGAVFRVPEADPIIKFDGPPGEVDGFGSDGEALDTRWQFLALNPVDGRLWALRRDGTLKSADIPKLPPDPLDPGTLEAALPYDGDDGLIDVDDLYAGLAFGADGTWFALRGDGKLFNTSSPGPALVDFPGSPGSSDSQGYRGVVVLGDEAIVLRDDGKLYRGTDTSVLVDLKEGNYFGLAVGTLLPDLEHVKNQPPLASSMTITAPEGGDIVLPVLAVDRDKPADELLVDVLPETLPAGATWDGVARTISWPAAGPAGTYKITVTVDDGVAKPVKAAQTIKIQTPDADPDKNIKPVLAKVKNAVALPGLPFSLPLPAFDRDGDALALSLNDTGELPEGVSFDEVGGVLHWDAPTVSDKGSNSFKFLVDDGSVVVKASRKVKVQTSLLAF